MGHRQKMTRKQLTEWDSMQYKRRLEANRGHNFQYLTDKISDDLERGGYKRLVGGNAIIPTTIHSEGTAWSLVRELRTTGHYARIFCVTNALRIKEYTIFYKKKKS